MVKLGDVAKVVRSKNAGPFLVTIDVLIEDRGCFEAASRLLTREFVASLYSIDPSEVLDVKRVDSIHAIKIVLRRRIPAGEPGDRDVYGAQQHAPILGVELVGCPETAG